jgi:tRNA nucleotidyltransferase (CCA-adding enzyme)
MWGAGSMYRFKGLGIGVYGSEFRVKGSGLAV